MPTIGYLSYTSAEYEAAALLPAFRQGSPQRREPYSAARPSRSTPNCVAAIRRRWWRQPAGSRASSWNKLPN